MTVAALSNVLRDVTFNSASNDSGNSRWIDNSGRGNHLPFTAGAHSATTIGGHDAWTPALDSSEYSEFRPCLGQKTLIFAIYHASTNNSARYYWEAGLGSNAAYAGNDHAGETETTNWLDDDRMFVRTPSGTAIITGSVSGLTTGNATLTQNAWNIVTVENDPDTYKDRIRVNDGAWVEATGTWNNYKGQIGHRARLGYWFGTINAQNGIGRYLEMTGLASIDPAYSGAITELKAAYGIT